MSSRPGIKLINLIVHDTQGQIGFWSGVTDGEVYGALIYYNGFDFSERGRGHGICEESSEGGSDAGTGSDGGETTSGRRPAPPVDPIPMTQPPMKPTGVVAARRPHQVRACC